MHIRRRRDAPVIAAASVLLLFGAVGCGQSSSSSSPAPTSKPSSALTPAAARSIVSNLWSERETALASLDTSAIGRFESAYAKQQDNAYINDVRCGCTPQKDTHPADAVVPQVPKSSVTPFFFAQIAATNSHTGGHAWYLVAVERKASSDWKLAHVNFGGYKTAPPLRAFTESDGYTRRVGARSRGQMTRLANASIRYATTHEQLTYRTDYGAMVRSRYAIKPARDGIYGLALPSGRVLSCFAMHRVDTYSLPSGLLQGSARKQWGQLLRPGIYKSITVDNAAPMCVVGRGVGKAPGTLEFKYDKHVIATTGVLKQRAGA